MMNLGVLAQNVVQIQDRRPTKDKTGRNPASVDSAGSSSRDSGATSVSDLSWWSRRESDLSSVQSFGRSSWCSFTGSAVRGSTCSEERSVLSFINDDWIQVSYF